MHVEVSQCPQASPELTTHVPGSSPLESVAATAKTGGDPRIATRRSVLARTNRDRIMQPPPTPMALPRIDAGRGTLASTARQLPVSEALLARFEEVCCVLAQLVPVQLPVFQREVREILARGVADLGGHAGAAHARLAPRRPLALHVAPQLVRLLDARRAALHLDDDAAALGVLAVEIHGAAPRGALAAPEPEARLDELRPRGEERLQVVLAAREVQLHAVVQAQREDEVDGLQRDAHRLPGLLAAGGDDEALALAARAERAARRLPVDGLELGRGVDEERAVGLEDHEALAAAEPALGAPLVVDAAPRRDLHHAVPKLVAQELHRRFGREVAQDAGAAHEGAHPWGGEEGLVGRGFASSRSQAPTSARSRGRSPRRGLGRGTRGSRRRS